MASRNTLHKTKLQEFKDYLDANCIGYRPGKGEYQVLQVCTPDSGWQVVFSRLDMPEHFTVGDKLLPLVRKYLESKKHD